jgi:hypothetical protein
MGLCEHGAHQVPKVLYQSQKKPSKVAFPSKSWIFLPFFLALDKIYHLSYAPIPARSVTLIP